MTLVSLPNPIYFPNFGDMNNAAIIFTSSTLSGAGQYRAYVFSANQDMTLSNVAFRVGAVAGSPTATVTIETLDASGLPSGTLWATNTSGTTGTLTANTFANQALTAAATITKGQVFCVKIAFASGTSFILQHISLQDPFETNLPYAVVNTGTPTKSSLSGGLVPLVALGSSSTVFYRVPGIMPIDSTGGGTFNNSTAGAMRGMVFTIPMNCRAIGVRWHSSNSVGDYNILLMDNSGTELSSSSTAFSGVDSAASTNSTSSAFFDNTVTLTAGTTYRIAVQPTTTTNVNVSSLVMTSTNFKGAFPGQSTLSYATFTTGGGWVDTTTQVPLMDLIIDQVDNGSGGGSSVVGIIGA